MALGHPSVLVHFGQVFIFMARPGYSVPRRSFSSIMPRDTLFESEKDLPQSDPRYRLLFENSMDGILLTSPDGKILDASPSACRILGRTREQIIDAGRDGLIDTSDPNLPRLIEERQRHGRAHGELTARRADGSLFPFEFSSAVFSDSEGNQRTCIIFRDISPRKSAEAERERLIGELQEALRKVRVLSGLLSICAACKKIRNERGQWETLETYIRSHSEAEFTHGICEECLRNLYPESSLR
jgi:PAS domain S-box-containing protein